VPARSRRQVSRRSEASLAISQKRDHGRRQAFRTSVGNRCSPPSPSIGRARLVLPQKRARPRCCIHEFSTLSSALTLPMRLHRQALNGAPLPPWRQSREPAYWRPWDRETALAGSVIAFIVDSRAAGRVLRERSDSRVAAVLASLLPRKRSQVRGVGAIAWRDSRSEGVRADQAEPRYRDRGAALTAANGGKRQ